MPSPPVRDHAPVRQRPVAPALPGLHERILYRSWIQGVELRTIVEQHAHWLGLPDKNRARPSAINDSDVLDDPEAASWSAEDVAAALLTIEPVVRRVHARLRAIASARGLRHERDWLGSSAPWPAPSALPFGDDLALHLEAIARIE